MTFTTACARGDPFASPTVTSPRGLLSALVAGYDKSTVSACDRSGLLQLASAQGTTVCRWYRIRASYFCPASCTNMPARLPASRTQAVVERLWRAPPRAPAPVPALLARAPSAPLPAALPLRDQAAAGLEKAAPPVLGGGTAQARLRSVQAHVRGCTARLHAAATCVCPGEDGSSSCSCCMHACSELGLLWALRQGRVAGAVGVPVPEHRPGDCLVWGAWERGVGGRGTGAAPILSYAAAGAAEGSGHGGGGGGGSGGGTGAGSGWAPTSVPRVVADTAHLDAVEVRKPFVRDPVRCRLMPLRFQKAGRHGVAPLLRATQPQVCGAGALAQGKTPRGCLTPSFPRASVSMRRSYGAARRAGPGIIAALLPLARAPASGHQALPSRA
jgi:hypothetical protein